MTTIYLIRHAEAEGNLYRRMHGHFDSMITPNGMAQIRALAKRFSAIPVDACYASDLLRTRTTAQAVYIPKGLPLVLEPAFREIDVGVWDDKEFGLLYTYEPEAIACFGKDPPRWQVEGSEPFEVYTKRFLEALTAVAQRHEGQTVAVFSHAAVMRGVILTLFPQQPLYPSENTGVTCLEYENGCYRLRFLNDASHLPPECSTIALQRAARRGMTHGQTHLWFRPGLTTLEGLQPPKTELCFTAMAEEEPAGALCLRERDEHTGEIMYMGLLPAWRSRGIGAQLLGKAVYYFREQGKEHLVLPKPADGCLDRLLARMELVPDENGLCRMALSLKMTEL